MDGLEEIRLSLTGQKRKSLRRTTEKCLKMHFCASQTSTEVSQHDQGEQRDRVKHAGGGKRCMVYGESRPTEYELPGWSRGRKTIRVLDTVHSA